jgi:1,4-dihydroxy-2-naphthoate octaprenyltransferase
MIMTRIKIMIEKKLIIMGGVLDKRYWKTFKIISLISSLVVILTPIIANNLIATNFSILGLVIGISYSLPPIRLKTLPGGDILANTSDFVCLFVIGLSYNFNIKNLDKYLI